MRVWPELPAAGELVRLSLPCPQQLVELSGYPGGGRLVALWWSPLGDELIVCDGTVTMTGRWRGWLCFTGHPLVCVFLDPYRLGAQRVLCDALVPAPRPRSEAPVHDDVEEDRR